VGIVHRLNFRAKQIFAQRFLFDDDLAGPKQVYPALVGAFQLFYGSFVDRDASLSPLWLATKAVARDRRSLVVSLLMAAEWQVGRGIQPRRDWVVVLTKA
jgi:hypothetical protein